MKSARHARLRRLSSTSVLALCVAAGLSGAAGAADTVNWKGTASNDWFNDANWEWGGHAPGTADEGRIDKTGVILDNATGYVGNLLIGLGSTGDLTVNDDLNSTSATFGWSAGSSGALTINGAGNAWINSGDIYVGNAGEGLISILGGASVSTGALYIGSGPTSTGTVTLENGSQLSSSGYLYVGFGGDGVSGANGYLNVLSGSDVTSANSVISNGTNTHGSAVVDGAGSTWDTTNHLLVGGGSLGTLEITNGGYVEAGSAAVANSAAASGSFVTVRGSAGGTASRWNVLGDLLLGAVGEGTLEILDGGDVDVDAAYLGSTGTGRGTIAVDDATLDIVDRIGVGYDGEGELTIRNGGTVDSDGAILGWNASASGTATVTGSGSRWDNTDTLFVGNLGDGFLTIADGGVVTSTLGYVGTENGSDSEATVTGAGSSWEMSDAFIAGHNTGAEGTVTISAGGKISALQGILGDLSGSIGTMAVTGTGSTWSAIVDPMVLYSGDLNVGRFGTGNLSVLAGGSVVGNRLHIANEAGSAGTALVSGAGSNMTITGRLSVGIEGDGILTVANGATISAGSIVIADEATSSGVLNIGAAAGSTAATAGTVTASTVTFGDGTGEIVFNHTASNYVFGADVEGDGTLSFLSGTTNLTGDYTDFTGALSIAGGYVSVNTSTLSVVADVLSGATLGGNGTLGNVAVASGGTVAPGNSIGTINVANITFAAGSIYSVEVNDAGASDLINASGTATIDSGASVNVGPVNGTDDGTSYTSGTVYTILTAAGGVTGTFGTLTDSFAFLDATLSYGANDVYLTLLRNGVSFTSFAETDNQLAVAGALETLSTSDALYNAVSGLGAAAVPGAFDDLAGDVHASAKAMLVDDSHFVRDAFNARLLDGDHQGYGFWTSAYGAWARSESDGNAGSLAYGTGGFSGGVDGIFADDWRIGLAASYSRTAFDVDSRSSSGTSDNNTLGAYGGRSFGPVDLRFGAAYTWHRLNTERTVDFGSLADSNEAGYDAATAQLFGEASYDVETGFGRISPFAGLAYVHLQSDGYSESGGVSALSGGAGSYATTYGTFGLRGERAVEIGGTAALFQGMLGWRHDFGDGTASVRHAFAGSDSFTVEGVPIASDVAVMEAGLSFAIRENATVGLSYAGQAGAGDWQQQLKGRLDIRF